MALVNDEKKAPPAPKQEPKAAPEQAPKAAPEGAPEVEANTEAPGKSQDAALAKIQEQIRQKTPANLRVAVQKIYVAGMKVMYSPETHQLVLKQLEDAAIDPGTAVGKGVATLITLLWRQSNGTMPIPAVPLAAVLLVCEALDFLEKTKMVEVTPQTIDTATQTVIAILMQKVGLTPEKMAQIAKQGPGAAATPDGAQPPQDAAQPPQQPPQGPQPTGLVNSQMGAPQ